MNKFILTLSIMAATQVFAANPNDETKSHPAQQVPLSWAELGLMQGFPPPVDKLVTRKNWQNPPFNRWAFQHMDQVLRTAHLSRGSGPVAEDRGEKSVGDSCETAAH